MPAQLRTPRSPRTTKPNRSTIARHPNMRHSLREPVFERLKFAASNGQATSIFSIFHHSDPSNPSDDNSSHRPTDTLLSLHLISAGIPIISTAPRTVSDIPLPLTPRIDTTNPHIDEVFVSELYAIAKKNEVETRSTTTSAGAPISDTLDDVFIKPMHYTNDSNFVSHKAQPPTTDVPVTQGTPSPPDTTPTSNTSLPAAPPFGLGAPATQPLQIPPTTPPTSTIPRPGPLPIPVTSTPAPAIGLRIPRGNPTRGHIRIILDPTDPSFIKNGWMTPGPGTPVFFDVTKRIDTFGGDGIAAFSLLSGKAVGWLMGEKEIAPLVAAWGAGMELTGVVRGPIVWKKGERISTVAASVVWWMKA